MTEKETKIKINIQVLERKKLEYSAYDDCWLLNCLADSLVSYWKELGVCIGMSKGIPNLMKMKRKISTSGVNGETKGQLLRLTGWSYETVSVWMDDTPRLPVLRPNEKINSSTRGQNQTCIGEDPCVEPGLRQALSNMP